MSHRILPRAVPPLGIASLLTRPPDICLATRRNPLEVRLGLSGCVRRQSAAPMSQSRQRSQCMGRKLYVGNLPYETGEAELQDLFARAGTVETVKVMRDMATGRARGLCVRRDEHGRGSAEGDRRAERLSARRSRPRCQRGASEARALRRRLRWRRLPSPVRAALVSVE